MRTIATAGVQIGQSEDRQDFFILTHFRAGDLADDTECSLCKSGAGDPQVTRYTFLLFGAELLLSHRMSDKVSFQITY